MTLGIVNLPATGARVSNPASRISLGVRAMAQTIPLVRPVQDRMAERAAVRAPAVPWYIWSSIVAVMSGAFGGTWDISWHDSSGRDTVLPAAQGLIYLCV